MYSFENTARKLARNPLGIIALFIVLVYGIAGLVTFSSGIRETIEPLIYFLVFFPVLVLVVFTWLVTKHSDKLYGPGDFANEDNSMKLRIAASLGAATAKHQKKPVDMDIESIVEAARQLVRPPLHPEEVPIGEIKCYGLTIGLTTILTNGKRLKR